MKKISIFTAFILILVENLCLPDFSAAAEEDTPQTTIISSNFDDGNVGKWTAFSGGTLSLDNSVAHSGDTSLKISNRTKTYQGPSLYCDSFFSPKETYAFDGWVYYSGDSEVTISWTMRYNDASGESSYETIQSQEISGGEWTELKNTMTVPENAVSCLAYFECSDASAEFYIDDVTISGNSGSQQNKVETGRVETYLCDFEENSGSWMPRGDVRIAHTDEYSQSGKYSIFTNNRTATWNGPMLSISDKIIKGKCFYYSAYVMYNGAEFEDSHVFHLELQYTLNGNDCYELVSAEKVKKKNWTKLGGYFTIPEEAENIYLYVQTDNLADGEQLTNNDLMPFYVDSVMIADGDKMKRSMRLKITISGIIMAVLFSIILFLVIKASKHLKKKRDALRLASIDSMTKVGNRNSYERKTAEFTESPSLCKGYYFGLCDVNFLKYINDNYGHDKGDEAIVRCAKALSRALGKNAEVYRTGGDEFVFFSKKPVADAVKQAIAEESNINKGYPFSAACGFGEYDGKNAPDFKAIIDKCDSEMYKNKEEIKRQNKEYSRK